MAMSGKATITFSQPGLQPRVFVVTSLSTPPWQVFEMQISPDLTSKGDLIFYRTFNRVPVGTHQYKIRIGDDQWVVDESRETATDGAGNCNNIIVAEDNELARGQDPLRNSDSSQHSYVEPAEGYAVQNTSGAASDEARRDIVSVNIPLNDQSEQEQEHKTQWARKDSVQPLLAAIPTQADKKTDEKHSPSDDRATKDSSSQALGHDHRLADANLYRDIVPNALTDHIEPGKDEDWAAPLFRYESFEPNLSWPGSQTQSRMQTVIENADDAEVDQTSSNAANAANAGNSMPSNSSSSDEKDNSEENKARTNAGNVSSLPQSTSISVKTFKDELSHGPLLSHEVGSSPAMAGSKFGESPLLLQNSDSSPIDGGELNRPPTLSHEADSLKGEPQNNQSLSPLLSHETGIRAENTDLNELDHAPPISHETNLVQPSATREQLGSGRSPSHPDDIMKEHGQEPLDMERFRREVEAGTFGTTRASTFPHENIGGNDCGYDDSPLLPHERSSAPSITSERSDGISSNISFPTFTDVTIAASPLFGRHPSGRIFRRRSTSSVLPHSLPRTDAEDDNLNDPSLEAFPTSRDQILERVATISSQMPEDETVPSPLDMYSPDLTVASQACSSVDLAPVSSHLSLNPITEDVVLEGDEGEKEPNLASPALEMTNTSDPSEGTPTPVLCKGEEEAPVSAEVEAGTSQGRAAAHRIARRGSTATGRHDGANEGAKRWGVVYAAEPGEAWESLMPYKSPEEKNDVSAEGARPILTATVGVGASLREGMKAESPAKRDLDANNTLPLRKTLPPTTLSTSTTATSLMVAVHPSAEDSIQAQEVRRRLFRTASTDSFIMVNPPEHTACGPSTPAANVRNNGTTTLGDAVGGASQETLVNRPSFMDKFKEKFGGVGRFLAACFGRHQE